MRPTLVPEESSHLGRCYASSKSSWQSKELLSDHSLPITGCFPLYLLELIGKTKNCGIVRHVQQFQWRFGACILDVAKRGRPLFHLHSLRLVKFSLICLYPQEDYLLERFEWGAIQIELRDGQIECFHDVNYFGAYPTFDILGTPYRSASDSAPRHSIFKFQMPWIKQHLQ